MRGRRFPIWSSQLLLLVALALAALADPQERLLRSIASDPSFKVRMQGLRVLSRRMEGGRQPPSAPTMAALSAAATKDKHHLVRGLACYVLGKLMDPRGRSALAVAKRDGNAFVRAQAEQALDNLARLSRRGSDGGDRTFLVVSTEPTPGVPGADELTLHLLPALRTGFQTEAKGRYQVSETGAGKGYSMRGTIAELSVAPTGNGETRVTVVVKITVATWPENNLRHVMSARASAKARGTSVEKLKRAVLRAAADRAIKDAIQELAGS